MNKSTKTTAGGIVACLGLLFTALVPYFDGDPETAPDIQTLGIAVAALGTFLTGLFSRDDNVSSMGGVASKDKKAKK